MRQVTENEIKTRIRFDNPWWHEGGSVEAQVRKWPRRAYYAPFETLARDRKVRRAVVLMGPRRVGKTVMLLQLIDGLMSKGVAGRSILYVSMDTPTYIGCRLDQIVKLFSAEVKRSEGEQAYVVFDEIQYLKDWEIHLKSLVDSYPAIKFIASGSAAAALRLKSNESGAGRFTDFLLPPLTFSEFLRFEKTEETLISVNRDQFPHPRAFFTKNIRRLNDAFVRYLNFGGFPEAVFSPIVQGNLGRFIANDIIDKVLLRDLPSLYGISNTQDLNRLFSTLAYNTGNEISLEALAQSSGIAKNTLRRYLDFLESAFLIKIVHRIDETARRFKRVGSFKAHLTNPSLRTALFGTVPEDDAQFGHLAESAIISHWAHTDMFRGLRYSRWSNGEVDMVLVDPATQEAELAEEVKWSDRSFDNPKELRSLLTFAKKNQLPLVVCLTRSIHGDKIVDGVRVEFRPASLHCYALGKAVDFDLLLGPTVTSYRKYFFPHA